MCWCCTRDCSPFRPVKLSGCTRTPFISSLDNAYNMVCKPEWNLCCLVILLTLTKSWRPKLVLKEPWSEMKGRAASEAVTAEHPQPSWYIPQSFMQFLLTCSTHLQPSISTAESSRYLEGHNVWLPVSREGEIPVIIILCCQSYRSCRVDQ